MTCAIIAHLLTRDLKTALNPAPAEVVRIQHPKFAALTVCEFSPDHVNEQHKLMRTKPRPVALGELTQQLADANVNVELAYTTFGA